VDNPIEMVAADTLIISLESAPADSITISGVVVFRDVPLTVGA
jgi:hypothetical protein